MEEIKKDKSQQIVNQTSMKKEQTKNKGGNPNWYKGMESPNPLGPKVTHIKLNALFTQAFLKDQKEHAESLFDLAFRLAREGDVRVLLALLNKFVPDLIKGEGFDSKNFTQLFAGIDAGDLRSLITNLRKGTGEKRSV